MGTDGNVGYFNINKGAGSGGFAFNTYNADGSLLQRNMNLLASGVVQASYYTASSNAADIEAFAIAGMDASGNLVRNYSANARYRALESRMTVIEGELTGDVPVKVNEIITRLNGLNFFSQNISSIAVFTPSSPYASSPSAYISPAPAPFVNPMVTNGLIGAIDASIPSSYSGSGTTANDISPANIGTFAINGPWSFVNNGLASYWNTPYGPSSSIVSTVAQNYLDFTIVFYPDITYVPPFGGICSMIQANNSFGFSLRFTCNGSSWTSTNPDNINGWTFPNATTYYVNGQPVTGNLNLSSSTWTVLGGGRTNTTGDAFASPWAFSIGNTGVDINPGRNFQGRIAAIYLYNRVLTQAEQVQNYNVIKARFGL
jgi:hypothetical protein